MSGTYILLDYDVLPVDNAPNVDRSHSIAILLTMIEVLPDLDG